MVIVAVGGSEKDRPERTWCPSSSALLARMELGLWKPRVSSLAAQREETKGFGVSLRCGRRGAGREGARRNEETDERHRERAGLTQRHRATRRRPSYRRRRVGSWHLPRSRPLSNFRPRARVARRPRTPAERDGRDTGPAKRTATTDAHGSTRPGRVDDDDAVRSKRRSTASTLLSLLSLCHSPFRAPSTADRGYLRIRAPRGRSRADGTQCRSYRTTDVHHFGKHTGHVIQSAGPGPPRGLLLPLPQKTARARLATEISLATRDAALTWAIRNLGPPRDRASPHWPTASCPTRATRKRDRTTTRWMSVGARENGRDRHDTAAVSYHDENYCAGQPLRERPQVCRDRVYRVSGLLASLRPAIYERNLAHFYFSPFNKLLLAISTHLCTLTYVCSFFSIAFLFYCLEYKILSKTVSWIPTWTVDCLKSFNLKFKFETILNYDLMIIFLCEFCALRILFPTYNYSKLHADYFSILWHSLYYRNSHFDINDMIDINDKMRIKISSSIKIIRDDLCTCKSIEGMWNLSAKFKNMEHRTYWVHPWLANFHVRPNMAELTAMFEDRKWICWLMSISIEAN